MTTLYAGVIGHPISHSKSPRLHGYWLKKYGVNGAYDRVDAPPGTFEATIRDLIAKGWRGANVTIPHKEAAFDIADEHSERAGAFGAANTLVFREDGSIYADNTDAYGFLENLKDRAPAWRPDGACLILGAGGAARAIAYALAEAGMAPVLIANRTRERAEALAKATGAAARAIDWEARDEAVAEVDLIVNTTSLGMKGQPPLALDLTAAREGTLVTDIVYSPLITGLLEDAQARNLPIVDGLGMLLHQGRPGFEAWFGVAPEVDEGLREEMLRP